MIRWFMKYLVVASFLCILVGCAPIETQLPEVIKQNPITLLYLDKSVIHFYCLDAPSCFPDVDLGDPIRTLNDPKEHPFSLWSAYYDHDSILYLNIGGSIWDYLVKVNPQTGEVEYLDLN